MQLPISSSFPDSEDSVLSHQLHLADANAELNRFGLSYGEAPSYEYSPSCVRANGKAIIFNPEVSVRFIRPRSNTMRSSVSDASVNSLNRYGESPLGPDSMQRLKESSPLSDDEEFERFYKTMPQVRVQASHSSELPVCRLSLDGLARNDRMSSYYEEDDVTATITPDENRYTRTRSISRDEDFFQTNFI
jgi:hypothetical protein